MAAKTKSKKQVRYLLSKGSPLSGSQKAKLMTELHSGMVKMMDKKHKMPSHFSQAKFNKAHRQVYS